MSAHLTVKCPNCGAPLSVPEGAESAVCEYCDCTVQLESASRTVHVRQHIVDEAALKNAELKQEMLNAGEEKRGEWKKLLRIWLAAFFGAVLLCWFGDAVNSGGAGFMKVILAGILVLGGGYLLITYPGGLPFVDGLSNQLKDLLSRPLPPKAVPQARTSPPPRTPVPQSPTPVPQIVYVQVPKTTSDRKKWTAFWLCFLLGFLGAHYFYVGRPGKGFAYLFTCGFLGIGWFVDLIVILSGGFRDADGLRVV